MSLSAPTIDSRTYQSLLDDAMARIATHNPEWTNFNHSDPGITLLELFAFLTDTLLYRANLIPERNRLKFLNLLGIPLTRASSASGLITMSNDHGPLQQQSIGGGVQVQAGSVSFHTDAGLDLLPIEAQVMTKQVVTNPPPAIQAAQEALYATFAAPPATAATEFTLYETVPLDPGGGGVTLKDTADSSLWIALLVRESDAAAAAAPADLTSLIAAATAQIASTTLSLGFVPVVADVTAADLQPPSTTPAGGAVPVTVWTPSVPPDGQVPMTGGVPTPAYVPLDTQWPSAGLGAPGVVQITLPAAGSIGIWGGVDALIDGFGAMPPSLPPATASRLITWLQLQQTGADVTLLWAGINATTVTQRTHVSGEVLPAGTGEPDQTVALAHTPVIDGSVALIVTESDGTVTQWTEIDDLLAAPPEVPVPDPRLPPGSPPPARRDPDVYSLDPTTGIIRFGDGARGRRPPSGAAMQVDYDYGAGSAGNVGAGSINGGVALPPGVTVTNPVPTWGGADAESVDEAEKQTSRYLQYRDRCVTTEDFQVVTFRTPGVDLGRVEVIPATNPDLVPFTAGTSPGAVTVMVIPNSDPNNPAAPEPDNATLSAIGSYLDPRRLLTTQLFLRGPVYVPIWVSVAVTVVAGQSIADVTSAVKTALNNFLAPIDPTAPPWYLEETTSPDVNPYASRGWPLQKAVNPLELQAVASRVAGVDIVEPVLVGSGKGTVPIPMSGLELPQVAGIAVVSGQTPTPISVLQGAAGGPGATGAGGGTTTGGGGTSTGGGPSGGGPPLIPVPVIPDTC